MAIKEAGIYNTQTGITGAASADSTIKLRPRVAASFQLKLTAGSPATGARLQVTNDPPADIDAGTAEWYVPAGTGYTLTDTGFVTTAGEGSQLTGVRADVSDGTWTLAVRQA